MTDDHATIGALVSELRKSKDIGGLPIEQLRAAGVASVQALIVDLTARGYRLELTGGGKRLRLLAEPRHAAAAWKRRQETLFEAPRRGPYDE